MTVRNFYVKASIDGRKTKLEGGPRLKDGGMVIKVLMRDEGEVVTALTIRCEAIGSDAENPILQVTATSDSTERRQVIQVRKYR